MNENDLTNPQDVANAAAQINQNVEDPRAALLAAQALAKAEEDRIAAEIRKLDLQAPVNTAIDALKTYDPAVIGPAIDALRSNTTIFPAPEKVRKARVVRTEAEKAADLIRHNAAVKQRELPKIDAWVKERVKLPE